MNWGRLALIALVLAALAASWRYTPLSEFLTTEQVRAWARMIRETSWAPVVLVLSYTPAALILFPRPVLTLIAVIAFGPWLGFVYSMTGILVSALATYYLGRLLEYEQVRRLVGEKLEAVCKPLRRREFLSVLAMRLVPVAPFGVEGIIAGAIGINVWYYSLATMLGMLPGVLTETVFGMQIAAALEDPGAVTYWLLGAVVILFGVIMLVARRLATKVVQ